MKDAQKDKKITQAEIKTVAASKPTKIENPATATGNSVIAPELLRADQNEGIRIIKIGVK